MEKIVILCVDDEPNVLSSLKIDLRRSLGPSYLVETAESGQETLSLLTELLEEGYEIAVVIVDYIMPGMKGDELLQHVHAKVPNAINIMLSGQADIDAVARSIEHAKLYRFMAKPWRSEDLTLTTQKALQSYENDRNLKLKTEEIQKLNAELTRINQSLENTVHERTLQLQATVKELQILSQLKDDFLHAVSHDLRTPVAGMLMILRRLQNKVSSESLAIALPNTGLSVSLTRELLDSLVQGSERQLKLLETLVEAHFSEIHGIPIATELVNFEKYIQQIANDLESWLQDQCASISVICSPDLPLIPIDPLQIRRIYENVISNACKYNRPGIQITLTASQRENLLYCTIRDNGVGMPMEECSRLFERYARGGARAQRSVGLGLGLFLCRQIIQEHGGEINAESSPGEGLTIWFTLPMN
jgi:two-component system, sensor histidine kinase and response regulator